MSPPVVIRYKSTSTYNTCTESSQESINKKQEAASRRAREKALGVS